MNTIELDPMWSHDKLKSLVIRWSQYPVWIMGSMFELIGVGILFG